MIPLFDNYQYFGLNVEMLLHQIKKCSFKKTKTVRASSWLRADSQKMEKTPNKPYTIIVEGNIGSGKTTFIKNFMNNSNILALSEPVEAWKDVAGHDLLQLLYNDIKSWAFTFQTYVQLTMMKLHERKTNRPVKIMERSLYSARNVFVENLFQMNILTPPEVAVLDEWYKWLLNKKEFGVDLIVYLRTDPEIAFQRIKQRCRTGELSITLEYIKKLHEAHENWLCKKTKFLIPAPVLLLDGNKNLSEIKEEYNYFQKQVPLLSTGQNMM